MQPRSHPHFDARHWVSEHRGGRVLRQADDQTQASPRAASSSPAMTTSLAPWRTLADAVPVRTRRSLRRSESTPSTAWTTTCRRCSAPSSCGHTSSASLCPRASPRCSISSTSRRRCRRASRCSCRGGARRRGHLGSASGWNRSASAWRAPWPVLCTAAQCSPVSLDTLVVALPFGPPG